MRTWNDYKKTMVVPDSLFLAAKENDLTRLKALIESGAEIEAVDSRGYSALMLAGYGEAVEAVRFLLDHGANPNTADAGGNSVLMGVAFKGNLPLLEILLGAGADPLLKNAAGMTAHDFAVAFGRKDIALRLETLTPTARPAGRTLTLLRIIFSRLKMHLPIHGIALLLFLGGCATMKSSEPKYVPYLDWSAAIAPEKVFQNTVGFGYLQTDPANNVYWVEQRPNEAGRAVLVQVNPAGEARELTPQPYSVRNRVFEYGGAPYTVHGRTIYFTNFSDQRIYKIDLDHGGQITPLTPAHNADGSLGKYADLSVSADGRWLVFDYEIERAHGEYPNYVGMLDLHQSGVHEAVIVAKGASFYRAPKFSPDGTKLAWLEWNHPFMTWDSTRLELAEMKNGHVTRLRTVAGSDHQSIADFVFNSSGELFYAQDTAGAAPTSPANFYNIYGFDPKTHQIRTVTKGLKDFMNLRAADSKLLCLSYEKGLSRASILDPATGEEHVLAETYTDVGLPISSADGSVYLQGVPDDRPAEILKINSTGKIQIMGRSAPLEVNPADISRAEIIEYPTQDGKTSHGYFYPPTNSRYRAQPNEKPPVRVLVHGGPTAMTSRAFSLSRLFWTSQGYAVFDVNYRGSFGFGREYRDALKHKWGVLEIEDVKDGLAYLKERGKISDQAVVAGGSAGGYTVQRLLTFYPDLFATGASYFGIGNLVTLQKLTHKLESHYLEQLIGGTLENNLSAYTDRSPINHLDRLKAPMIIFQGSDDKVVPPENSREMADILKRKGIEYEYYEYPGEGHGFRKSENLTGSLVKESQFFKRVLRRH